MSLVLYRRQKFLYCLSTCCHVLRRHNATQTQQVETLSEHHFIRSQEKNTSSPKYRTMKAWQIHQYGELKDLVFDDSVRVPHIREPSDVLVEIHAASVNVIDVRMLAGYGSTLLNFTRALADSPTYSMEFPLTLGRDFSGVVIETGRGVSHVKQGDEVWGALWPQKQGTHAEYCIVPGSNVCKKPPILPHVEAASIPYSGLTAWGALSITGELNERNAAGKRVLVLGGSGGVGTIAVQMLKLWGAEVVTTCSTDAMPMMISLGANHVIDYTNMDVHRELGSIGRFDLILNNIPTQKMEEMLPHLKPWVNSKYVTVVSPLLRNFDTYGLPFGLISSVFDLSRDLIQSMRTGSSCRWGFFIGSFTGLEYLTKIVTKKKLLPVIDKVFPFEEVSAAYQKVLDGHARGKTVIKIR